MNQEIPKFHETFNPILEVLSNKEITPIARISNPLFDFNPIARICNPKYLCAQWLSSQIRETLPVLLYQNW